MAARDGEVASIALERREIAERVHFSDLLADVPANRQRFVERGQRLVVLAQPVPGAGLAVQ